MRQDAFGGVMDFKLDGAGFGDTIVRCTDYFMMPLGPNLDAPNRPQRCVYTMHTQLPWDLTKVPSSVIVNLWQCRLRCRVLGERKASAAA